MENHFASIWEAVADVAADRDAVVQGTLRPEFGGLKGFW